MRFLTAVWLLAFVICVSCAPKSLDDYQTGETEEQITQLLNERDFGRAIWLIENRDGPAPEGRTAFLLAQAYLGRAGIEPLAFAARVTEAEPDSEAARAIFPNCPKGRLDLHEQIKPVCIVKRVYLLAPNADTGDFARARALFRRAYPDPASAPTWVNTLIGMVETISLVKRAGDLYVYSRGVKSAGDLVMNRGDVKWFKGQGEGALEDARHALARGERSSDKISRLLNGYRAQDWFERTNGAIQFAETVGFKRFLDFVRENLLSPSDEIRYGESLDKLRDLLNLLEKQP